MNDVILSLQTISKQFDGLPAVKEVSLDIHRGEIFTLLGPSGCGKTTSLRLVAGLERLDGGEIHYKGLPIASYGKRLFVPPHRRDIGMVFQSYAIWPHLTVFENVAYPLKARGQDRKTIDAKVGRVLNLVGLGGFENRLGPLLSGGQQQRVALARALVYEPDLLLLDEPFSNLDVKLREQMRVEIRLLQRKIGISILLVTHDQLEALSLSDTIAVMNAGEIVQTDRPMDLYRRPRDAFVRDFLGRSALLRGKVVASGAGSRATVQLQNCDRTVTVAADHTPGIAVGAEVMLAARPEDIVVELDQSNGLANRMSGTIKALLFAGDRLECLVQCGDQQILSYLPHRTLCQEGQAVQLFFPENELRLWPLSQ